MCFLSKAVLLVVLLSWTTASLTPEECVDLDKTLSAEELHTIFGKWILVEGYGDTDFVSESMRTAKSSHAEFIPSNNNQTVTFKMEHTKNETCIRQSTNFTVSENTIKNSDGYNVSADFLTTCADCLLMRYSFVTLHGKKGRFLFLFGKTGKLPDSELEKTRKQAICLDFNYPPHTFHSEQAEFCREESEATEVKEPEQK